MHLSTEIARPRRLVGSEHDCLVPSGTAVWFFPFSVNTSHAKLTLLRESTEVYGKPFRRATEQKIRSPHLPKSRTRGRKKQSSRPHTNITTHNHNGSRPQRSLCPSPFKQTKTYLLVNRETNKNRHEGLIATLPCCHDWRVATTSARHNGRRPSRG